MKVSQVERELVDLWLKDVFAGVFQPSPTQEIWEWAEENLRIPSSESKELAGQFVSFTRTPYVKEIMKWVREPGQKEMVISKSSQIGVTMSVIVIIVWMVVHQPTNIGYYIDTTDEAKKISRTRLKRWITENNILDEIGDSEDDMNTLTYFFRGMTIYLHGSYSGGAYRNKSLGFAILDELDAHPDIDDEGTTYDLAAGRVKVPQNSKLLAFSTPTIESGQTWSGYMSGTQERMHCECPHCGHMQPLVWPQMRFDHCKDLAGEWIGQKVLDETYYECELGCKIEQKDKHKFLQTKYEWVAQNKLAVPNKRSLHISDLYSPFVTWGKLATEFVDALKFPIKMKNVIQQRFGEASRESGGQLKEADILRLRGTYKKGEIPLVPALVTMTVDVQKVTMKLVIQAWTKAGDMYVINWVEVDTWEQVAEIIDTPIEGINGEQHYINAGLVDEGDGNRHLEVRRFCLPRIPHFFPVKGRAGVQVKDLIYPSTVYSLDGQDMYTWHVDDHAFKRDLLFNRIKREKKDSGMKSPYIYLPRRKDVDPGFIAELLAERLEFKQNRHGYEEWQWVKKGENDYLDCLKYALALWQMLVGEIESDEEEPQEVVADLTTA